MSLAGVLLLLFGPRLVWRLKWVLAFLVWLFPLPGRAHRLIALPLQTFAARSAVFCLELMGYLGAREGNVLKVDAHRTVAVEEACSGLRMLTAFLIVGATLAFLVRRPAWQKVVLTVSSLPVAILANTVRLVVVAIGYQHAWGGWADRLLHDFAGLAMMPFAVALLLIELRLLGHPEGTQPARVSAPGARRGRNARFV